MKRIAPFIALLLILTLIVPVFAQDPGGSQRDAADVTVGGALSSESTVTREVDKAAARAAKTAAPIAGAEGIDLKELEKVSIIVTFDESVNAKALANVSGGTVIHRYERVFNGASLILEGSKVEAVASVPGVTGVYLDKLEQLHTDVGPGFIGAPDIWVELGRGTEAGEGIIVGILDTGIWPEHPSFSDPDLSGNPYPAPPGVYDCNFGSAIPGDVPFECNNKLIGAYRFMGTYEAFGPPLEPGEYLSARDDDGHGTHTASTAAGNADVEASIFGEYKGTVTGVAPRAHVIAYKVCGAIGCYGSDSAAAVEQAIIDGANVLNFSIGGGSAPYGDGVSLAFLSAFENGIFVAASAGNSGPDADTTDHREPWTTTVGASTHNRAFLSDITLSGPDSPPTGVWGGSVTPGVTDYNLVDAEGIPDSVGDTSGMCLEEFLPGTFNPNDVVLCNQYNFGVWRTIRVENVAAGGGGGVIFHNSPVVSVLPTDNHVLPTVHVANDVGQPLKDYLVANPGAVTVSFTAGQAMFSPDDPRVQPDVMASFSSRGGPGQRLGISKPDVTAPGVSILAGASPLHVSGGALGEYFQSISGTSMSSPHVAGSAALLMDLNPGWTPGQVKSAMMMSAETYNVYKEDGVTPADPFDYGSGRVALTGAGHPSLTISDTGASFLAHEDDLWNANYPSLYVPVMPGQITVQRTLHNEVNATQVWKTSTVTPPDVKVKVNKFINVPAGGDKTIKITVDARNVPLGEVRHAELRFHRRNETLHFPITIVRDQPSVLLDKACSPAVVGLGGTTDCTITAENASFDPAKVKVIDKLPGNLQLIPASVVGANAVDNGVEFQGILYGMAAPLVDVAVNPLASPYGYLGLASLGAPPNVFPTDESCDNFITDPYFYAGETWTAIGMVSNGYAVVGGCSGTDDIDFINTDLPNPLPPNNVLAPFWTDLNGDAGGDYYAYIISDGPVYWTVLEWENAPEWGDGELSTFQIWVGHNGYEDISFTYGPTVSDGDGGWLTVGAENEYGNSGAMTYLDGVGTPPSPSWPYDDPGYEVEVFSVPGAPGETHVITFSAEGVQEGNWMNCATLRSDQFQGSNIMCFRGRVDPD